jgi:acyl-CoA synthetase (AMP-forming)/AMP-acid ligase II
VLDRASAALPGVAFIQAYAQSELSPVATILHAREHLGDGHSRGRHRIVAQHPAVAQCAVIGIPNERRGEEVHAVVMRRPGTKVDPVDIIAFCNERIAHYKCPRSVDIRDEALPMSGPGKILKRELRAPFWEGRKWQVS